MVDSKRELDALAPFLQISAANFQRAGDYQIFQKYNWVTAVEVIIEAAGAMRLGTYAVDSKTEKSVYTFNGWTYRNSETLTNGGVGTSSKENDMVRTSFCPSDDATMFQFLVPANMVFAAHLESASETMWKLDGERAANLTKKMRGFATGVYRGIGKHAIVSRLGFGSIFAYKVDGFGSANLIDDANVPSLLAIPLWNFIKDSDVSRDFVEICRNTRRFVLGHSNSYFMKGPVISTIGRPYMDLAKRSQ